MPTILFNPYFGAENAGDGGGLKLSNTPVYLVFWGTGWGGGENATTLAIEQAARSVLNSSYLIRLQQYGSDGTAYYNADDFVNWDPSNQFQTDDLGDMIEDEISKGALPDEGASTEIKPLFVVVTPPGITSDQSDAGGWHTEEDGHFEIWLGSKSNPDGTFNLDWFTKAFGHELVESISDPESYSGIFTGAGASFPNPPPKSSEIADYEAALDSYRIGGPNGVLVQPYWSQQDGAFVVPDGTLQNFYLEPHFLYNDSSGFFLDSNILVVNMDQSGNSANTLYIEKSSRGGVQIDLNGEIVSFEPGYITQVQIIADNNGDGTGFHNTIYVVQTLGNVPVTIYAGNSTTNLIFSPYAQNLDDIKASVTVFYGPSSTSTVSLGDQANAHDADWTISESGSPTFGSITRTGMQPIYLDFINSNLNVVAYGGKGNNSYKIDNEAAAVNTWLGTGDGNDTVNVIQARGGLTVDAGKGGDTVNVTDARGGLTIDATTGNCNVNISSIAQRAGLLTGSVTFNGNSNGVSELFVYDQQEPVAMTWILSTKSGVQSGSPVTYGTMRRSAWPFEEIDFTGVEIAGLYGGVNNTGYVVQDTSPGTSTGIETGATVNTIDVLGTTGDLGINDQGPSGSNVVTIGNSTDGVQSIHGRVNVSNNGGGSDAVTIDNSAVDGNFAVTLAAIEAGPFLGESLTGLAPAEIDCNQGINKLSISTGDTTGLDFFGVQATNCPTYLSTKGLEWVAVGNDGTLQDIKGELLIPSLMTGAADLLVDDSKDLNNHTVIPVTLSTIRFPIPFTAFSLGIIDGLAPAQIRFGYRTTKFVDITTGPGKNTVNVEGAGVPTNLHNNLGQETVNVGNGGLLSDIQGELGIDNEGGIITKSPPAINLVLDDSADSQGKTAVLGGFGSGSGLISGFAPAYVDYNSGSLTSLTLKGGHGGNTFNVQFLGAGAPVTINTGGGNNIVNVGSTSNSLDRILGPLTVDGQGTDTINVNDQGTSAGHSYGLTSSTLTRTGAATLSFNSVGKLEVNAGGGTNKFAATSIPPSTAVTLTGGSGSNTLVGPNTTNTWDITGTNAGTLDGTVTFSSIQNLTGGSGLDAFIFSAGQTVTGKIDGGGGGDWLDYAAYITPVTVKLWAHTATGVGGGIANIRNVRGGKGGNTLAGDTQGNILIGGAGADTITGGPVRSILIGDKGKDTVTGGVADDIVIGGFTDFDSSSIAHDLALASILAEWQSSNLYKTRIGHIKNGGGLNGSNKFVFGVTVHDDGSANTLTGGPGQDWFFRGAHDTITDLEAGEQVN
jgi:hypothetical protein